MAAVGRCTGGAPQVLIKFTAEAEIHVIQHDCGRQRGWWVREALQVCQPLTAAASWQGGKHQQRRQQQMIPHTEGQQSRGETVIHLFHSVCLLSFSLRFTFPRSFNRQSRSAFLVWLSAIHPSILQRNTTPTAPVNHTLISWALL